MVDPVRLECLKLAVQVSTAEALETSKRAPSVERVAELTEQFYALVNVEVKEMAPEAVPTHPRQAHDSKKPKADKDKIFD